MTYKEAKKLIETNKHLISTYYGEDEISVFLIAPLNHEHLPALAYNFFNDTSSESILRNYSDFDVVVLFNADDFPITGVMQKDSLSELLNRMKKGTNSN